MTLAFQDDRGEESLVDLTSKLEADARGHRGMPLTRGLVVTPGRGRSGWRPMPNDVWQVSGLP